MSALPLAIAEGTLTRSRRSAIAARPDDEKRTVVVGDAYSDAELERRAYIEVGPYRRAVEAREAEPGELRRDSDGAAWRAIRDGSTKEIVWVRSKLDVATTAREADALRRRDGWLNAERYPAEESDQGEDDKPGPDSGRLLFEMDDDELHEFVSYRA